MNQFSAAKTNALLKLPEMKLRYSALSTKDGASVDVIFHLAPETDDKKTKTPEKPILKDIPWFKAGKGEIEKGKTWHIGLGPLKNLNEDVLGETFASAAGSLLSAVESINIILPKEVREKFSSDILLNLLVSAFELKSFPVDFLKKSHGKNKLRLKKIHWISESPAKDKPLLKKYQILARHMNGMRQLQSLPANILTAETMEKRVRDLAKEYGLKLKVFKKSDLEKMGAGGILAVNQGSAREPRMLVLEYKSPKARKKPFVIVGKGVTFDTGGISLKPSSDMHEMKYDMSGSAAAIHGLAAIAELGLPVHAVAVVGMVENMPDGAAFKPGDVYQSLKGHTIEVQNTDAEGRLVLGDLLAYADKTYKPELMVDLATLTGAIVVALGPYYTGLFTEKTDVREAIEEAAKKSGEPVWAMPMDPKFKQLLKSDIADYNNIGGRWGGSSSAAAFLSVFVEEKTRWAHLDIAGTGFIKSGYNVYPSVATGVGVRLLATLAENL